MELLPPLVQYPVPISNILASVVFETLFSTSGHECAFLSDFLYEQEKQYRLQLQAQQAAEAAALKAKAAAGRPKQPHPSGAARREMISKCRQLRGKIKAEEDRLAVLQQKRKEDSLHLHALNSDYKKLKQVVRGESHSVMGGPRDGAQQGGQERSGTE